MHLLGKYRKGHGLKVCPFDKPTPSLQHGNMAGLYPRVHTVLDVIASARSAFGQRDDISCLFDTGSFPLPNDLFDGARCFIELLQYSGTRGKAGTFHQAAGALRIAPNLVTSSADIM